MGPRKCKCNKRDARYLKNARRFLCDPCAVAEGLLVPCYGEAHGNAFIDNCSICAPRWALIEPPTLSEGHALWRAGTQD